MTLFSLMIQSIHESTKHKIWHQNQICFALWRESQKTWLGIKDPNNGFGIEPPNSKSKAQLNVKSNSPNKP